MVCKKYFQEKVWAVEENGSKYRPPCRIKKSESIMRRPEMARVANSPVFGLSAKGFENSGLKLLKR